MRNKFDMQLDLLNEQLTHMGELCEVAINRGTEALKKGDLKQAAEVIRADEEIDQMEKDAEIIISENKSEATDIQTIGQMSESVAKMVRDSVNAYVEKDLELSRQVMEADDAVDRLFEENKQELINFISDNKGVQGKKAIDLIMVAKYLERIGDHATNIAEWVEFSITGIHKDSQV